MSTRDAQVKRLLDAYKAQRSEALAGRADSPAARQAMARFESARRNASRAEFDEFTDQSLDDVLGPGWRNGR